MMSLLVFREQVKNFYHRYDIYIIPVVKFLFALVTIVTINKELGYDARLKTLPVVLALSLLCAFTPSAVMVLVAALLALVHVFFISPIISAVVLVFLMIIYFLYARFTPNLGYIILAIPILYYLKIPYTIPLLLGIISTPMAVVPTACGVLVYYVFQVINSAISVQVNKSVDDILQLYTNIIDNVIGNKQMIMSIVIFALMLIVVYYVRRMRVDYAFEIAIGAGALTSILGFLISDLILDKAEQILAMILGTIVSALIVFIVQFFQLTLDYSGVEHVQFEDDVYYYYVKAIPKMTVTTPQMKVKHINVKNAVRGMSKFDNRHNNDLKDSFDYDIDLDNDDDN
ncbi:MAG: hypothetical protein GX757_10090 [Clostridiales bacterium]|nr:hypothetical protein [Clostridiales bacterium]